MLNFLINFLLIRTFLNDLGGNPNKKNSSNETSLHMACNLAQQKSLSAQERRAACVMLLLQWRGVSLSNGDKEKISLTAVDQVRQFYSLLLVMRTRKSETEVGNESL
jgi:hypothetical protein